VLVLVPGSPPADPLPRVPDPQMGSADAIEPVPRPRSTRAHGVIARWRLFCGGLPGTRTSTRPASTPRHERVALAESGAITRRARQGWGARSGTRRDRLDEQRRAMPGGKQRGARAEPASAARRRVLTKAARITDATPSVLPLHWIAGQVPGARRAPRIRAASARAAERRSSTLMARRSPTLGPGASSPGRAIERLVRRTMTPMPRCRA